MSEKEKIFDIWKKANILKSVELANKSYLKLVLSLQTDPAKKELIQTLFARHMKELSDFCIENFIKKDILTEKFIRDLHKLHFPPWYTESQKTSSWDGSIIYMIPWVYKTIVNFNYVKPSEVKKEMSILVNNYNEKIDILKNEEKYHLIIDFLIHFLRIHPFGNGNGRVISILIDIMLIKYNFNPIHFKYIQTKDTNFAIKNIKKSIKYNDRSFIENYIKIYT